MNAVSQETVEWDPEDELPIADQKENSRQVKKIQTLGLKEAKKLSKF